MFDRYIDGLDATRLLSTVRANNYENFAVGQAKQFVPVPANGDIVTDGILLRETESKYVLTGIPALEHWVQYHGEKGGYDVASDEDRGRHGDIKLHFYAFGGLSATSEWIENFSSTQEGK